MSESRRYTRTEQGGAKDSGGPPPALPHLLLGHLLEAVVQLAAQP